MKAFSLKSFFKRPVSQLNYREIELHRQEMAKIKTALMPIHHYIKLNFATFLLNVLGTVFFLTLVLEHFSLYPLIEHRTEYIEMIGRDSVTFDITHTDYIHNEDLIQSLLRRYVIMREQINMASQLPIYYFSAPEVIAEFDRIQKSYREQHVRSKMQRFIEISGGYQKLSGKVRQFKIEAKDIYPRSETVEPRVDVFKFEITLEFDFLDRDVKDVFKYINPAGLIITKYKIVPIES